MVDKKERVLVGVGPDVTVSGDLPEEGTIESLKETQPALYAQIQELFKQGEAELKRRNEEEEE